MDMLQFRDLRIVSAAGFIANFVVPLIILVLPFYIITTLGLTNTHLSIAIFVVSLSHAMQFLMGSVCQRIGERKSMFIGLLSTGIFFVLLFFTKSFEWFLVILFLRGIGAGLWNVSAWSFMSNIAEKHNIEGKVVGSYSSISRIAISISFAATGALLVGVQQAIFVIYGIILFIPIILFAKFFLSKPVKA